MNVDAVPAGVEPTPLGHSRGRWDGDTLVYDIRAYDPATFAAPIDKPRVIVWHWEPGLTVGTDSCVPYYE
ncbi:MAG TPA: hypothetical protein VGC50_05155 [Gammaproteobacteria bacterium]|jgi:hypothetical protein